MKRFLFAAFALFLFVPLASAHGPSSGYSSRAVSRVRERPLLRTAVRRPVFAGVRMSTRTKAVGCAAKNGCASCGR